MFCFEGYLTDDEADKYSPQLSPLLQKRKAHDSSDEEPPIRKGRKDHVSLDMPKMKNQNKEKTKKRGKLNRVYEYFIYDMLLFPHSISFSMY